MKALLGVVAAAALLVGGCETGGNQTDRVVSTGSWERLGSKLVGVPVAIGDEVVVVSGGRDQRMKAAGIAGGSSRFQPLARVPLPWRCCFTAVGADREVLVWGGSSGIEGPQGASYDAVSESWKTLPAAPIDTSGHTAVWTGDEMLVWGGERGGSCSAPTARTPISYGPEADRWQRGVRSPKPGRIGHVAAWDGKQMLVWGGTTRRSGSCEPTDFKADGLVYSPLTGIWGRIPQAPIQWLEDSNAVWTGSELLVWNGGALAIYDPATSTWRAAPPPPLKDLEVVAGAPRHARIEEAFAWTGDQLIIWGGRRDRDSVNEPYSDGAIYDPTSNQWALITPGPDAVAGSVNAVWAESSLVVVGPDGAARLTLDAGPDPKLP